MKKIFAVLSLLLIGFTATQSTFAYSQEEYDNLEQDDIIHSATHNISSYVTTQYTSFMNKIIELDMIDNINEDVLLILNVTQNLDTSTNDINIGYYEVVSITQLTPDTIQLNLDDGSYISINDDPLIYVNGLTPSGGVFETEIYNMEIPIETSIFDALDGAVTGIIGLLSALVVGDASVTSLFYTETDGLKIMGILALMAFGYGMVKMAFYFIKRHVSLRGWQYEKNDCFIVVFGHWAFKPFD